MRKILIKYNKKRYPLSQQGVSFKKELEINEFNIISKTLNRNEMTHT